MKYYNVTRDEEVEVPSLQEHPENEEYSKVDTLDDMRIFVECMGFASLEDFDNECDTRAESLVGKWFTLTGKANGRFAKQPVFILED